MSNSTSTNGGTIITVPAGANWIGSVQLSATLTVAVGAAGASATPSVTVSGSGGNLNNGDTVVAVALACPAVALASLVGAQTTASATCGPMNIQARGNPVSLILNFPAGVTAVATACGENR